VTAQLARLPLARIFRRPRVMLPALAWIAVGVAGALIARHSDASRPADLALLGAYGAIALPLLSYVVVAGALGGEGLARSGRALVAFGASPVRVALASLLVAAVASALLGAALGASVAAIAHGPADPPLARDLAATAYAGALGGAAYAAYFGFGASFGARGGGRAALLVVDLLIGSGHGVLAFVTPRANVASLLGGDGPLGASGRASAIALGAQMVVFAALALLRARRQR
jgi:hypothetical protein